MTCLHTRRVKRHDALGPYWECRSCGHTEDRTPPKPAEAGR